MSNQQIEACAGRLQYLFEVLHSIRTLKGRRFHEIEVELSSLLVVLTVSSEYITFQEVMRFCDKCGTVPNRHGPLLCIERNWDILFWR